METKQNKKMPCVRTEEGKDTAVSINQQDTAVLVKWKKAAKDKRQKTLMRQARIQVEQDKSPGLRKADPLYEFT